MKNAAHAELADAAMVAITDSTGAVHETLNGHRLDRPNAFWCPNCQVDVYAGAFRAGVDFTCWPLAEILDSVRWQCRGSCRRIGTRWQLERLVLENVPALDALIEPDA